MEYKINDRLKAKVNHSEYGDREFLLKKIEEFVGHKYFILEGIEKVFSHYQLSMWFNNEGQKSTKYGDVYDKLNGN